MICKRCAAVLLVLALVGGRPADAADFFWQSSGGGAFATPANWLPAVPAGPGGAADTVNFDLGVAAANRYLVTGVAGQNKQLLVHKDAVQLAVTDYTLVNAGAAAPSLVVGVANGDVGNVLFSGSGTSILRTDVSSLGSAVGSTGIVTADGLQWNGTGNLRVGDAGVGALVVRNGADVTQGSAWIGNLANSAGTAMVNGSTSTWSNGGELVVGRMGGGFLSMNAGGRVTSGQGTIAAELASTGTVFVNDTNSSWKMSSSPLTVGGAGDGELLVQAGGAVESSNGFVARLSGGEGSVSVTGGGSKWDLSGRLTIGGDVVTGVAGGQGAVDVTSGGAVTAAEDIAIYPTGRLRIVGGTVTANEIGFQGAGGHFDWISGTLRLGTYHGNLTNAAGLLEGRSLINRITIDGNYTQQNSGTLRVGIGGPTPNTSYDVVAVGGTASLDGMFEIEQLAGYIPSPTRTFTVLDAAALTGSFDSVASGARLAVMGGTTGGTFLVHYGAGSPFDPTNVVLSAFQITGDYNLNGIVDAADYTVWRDTLGSTTDLRANGDNTGASAGVVDAADFAAWKNNFGKKATGLGSAAVGAVDAVAVPEPEIVALTLLALIFIPLVRTAR
jgi:T5SS/PEP-CTERM-associated repeat protein